MKNLKKLTGQIPGLVLAFVIILFVMNIIFIKNAEAAYLEDVPLTYTQPDGSEIHIFASGDEYHNWLHDEDKYTIILDDKGYYVYALERDGNLVPSSFIVGQTKPKRLGIYGKLAGLRPEINLSADEIEAKVAPKIEERSKTSFAAPTTGTINSIVIFIRFNDQPEFSDQLSDYDDAFNATSGSSQMTYYEEVSNNQLTISSTLYPESAGPHPVSYQDPHDRGYFSPFHETNNPEGYDSDLEREIREFTLLDEAVHNISGQVPPELDVDSDNDGNVDAVCFMIQGPPDGWSDLLWPHHWELKLQNANINGARVWDYTLQLSDTYNVGVLAHEMFHNLGAPDLYHYSQDGLSPVGSWDLMQTDLNPPQHMTTYMKMRYGGWFAAIPEITVPGTYALSPVSRSTYESYKISSPYSGSEYFIVEYRKKEGTFESGISGSGLIIYRINTNQDGAGNADGPPDEVYIYRPGGTTTVNGNLGNAFFSSDVGRTVITDETDPSSFLSSGSAGGLHIYNIGSASDTISFKVSFSNIYVDPAWGGSEQGSYSSPYNTIVEGVNAVTGGGYLFLKGGSYTGTGNVPITVNKQMTINNYEGIATVGQ